MLSPLIASVAFAAVAFQAPPPSADAPPPPDQFKPDPSWKALSPSIWFDPKGRRLAVRARVVLREGPLEHLLCLKGTKEHEAILATPAAPKKIMAGLILTGAEPGHPVRFAPKFEPPAGTPIAIELEWDDAGKTKRADARDWVLDERAKKALTTDWVFAGSEFVKDPISKQDYFAGDDGDLVTVANFASAILDLPIASTANDADRVFVPFTERIPPRGTPVTIFFKPKRPPNAAPAKKAGEPAKAVTKS